MVTTISAFCWPTTQTPLHNQLPSRCRWHKVSYSNLVPKLVAMATLDTRSLLCLHRIAWLRKSTPRIIQRVANYHTTKIIAYRKQKIGCQLSLSTCGHPSNTRFFGPIQAHKPNGVLIGSAISCTDDCRVSCYFTMGCPFPTLKKLPLITEFDLDPYLIHGSLGSPESSTKRHLDQFSRFRRAH